MSECNKCNGTLFVCENHPDQEAHECKHCGGAGMPCECTKMTKRLNKLFDGLIILTSFLFAIVIVFGVGESIFDLIVWWLR